MVFVSLTYYLLPILANFDLFLTISTIAPKRMTVAKGILINYTKLDARTPCVFQRRVSECCRDNRIDYDTIFLNMPT